MPLAKTKLGLSLIVIITLGAGCSEFVYNTAQNNHQHRCEKLPPHQYDECLEQSKQTYKHYQADREALLNEKGESR